MGVECPVTAQSEAPSGDSEHAADAGRAGAPVGDPALPDVPVPATHEDIVSAPVGTLIHRVCQCPFFHAQRAESQVRMLVEAAGDLDSLPHELQCAFSSGLIPVPRLPLRANEQPPAAGTFEWVRWCEDEDLDRSFSGTVYTDGSRIHANHPDTRRLGWSFVVLSEDGRVVAAARGSPPAHVHDIPGAEAWAILQAVAYALPGSSFWSDCKPCVDALHAGRAWACSARRPLARVFGLLFDCLEHKGHSAGDVTWMPAHTTRSDVGSKLRGDGRP